MKGDIILVPFPNSDLTQGKLRPALVLYEDALENETTIAYIPRLVMMKSWVRTSLAESKVQPGTGRTMCR